MGRHIAEEDHDARIVRQIIALGTRLALRFPEDAYEPIETAPLDRRDHPNPFGMPIHGMPVTQ
ncbi:hypothetical protein D9M68_1004300 [compost metagenome]